MQGKTLESLHQTDESVLPRPRPDVHVCGDVQCAVKVAEDREPDCERASCDDSDTASAASDDSVVVTEKDLGALVLQQAEAAQPHSISLNNLNSSEVQLGPRLNYNAPVTINQFVNVANQNAADKAQLSLGPDRGPPLVLVNSTKIPWWKRQSFFFFTFFSILLIVALVVILVILTRDSGIASHSPRSYPIPDPVPNPNISLSNGVIIASKEEWYGRPPRYVRQLLHPTPYVVVAHTAGPKCKDFSKCSELLRNYQDDHVGQYDQPDIGYNFLIDGVGEVYEGRGWDVTNFISDFVKRCNIAVAFMGNYLYDTIDKKQIQSFEALLELGLKLGKLTTDYRIVLHSQTSSTLSPGKNIELALASLPHRCLENCDKGVQCVMVNTTKLEILNYSSMQEQNLATEGTVVNGTV